jgi:hypothetical protein
MDTARMRREREQATVKQAENFIFITFLTGICKRNSVYVFDYLNVTINSCHALGGWLYVE